MSDGEAGERGGERAGGPHAIDEFLGEPTRDLDAWRWLWTEDRRFPVRSHRGLLGRVVVLFKRLLAPLVRTPQNDLWERQRVFNLIALEHLQRFDDGLRGNTERLGWHDGRIERLEEYWRQGLEEVMAHNDALFARLDQKTDRLRREVAELLGRLGALTATSSANGDAALARALEEHAYLRLEARHRGTEEEIRKRLEIYLPFLAGGEVLDLGCGRGEFLELLRGAGIAARGVDSSAEMVAICRGKGLTVVEGDLFSALAAEPEAGLGAVVSFHVIEHLPPPLIDRLVKLAWRALRPGGALILETPSPLSLVVAARNFWLDPTHQRPVHPELLRLFAEAAGFMEIRTLPLRPFAESARLPELDLARFDAAQRPLADAVNRLRDRIDELLFGHQDYGLIARKPAAD